MPSLVEKTTVAALSSDSLKIIAHNSTFASVPSVTVYEICSKPMATPKRCRNNSTGEMIPVLTMIYTMIRVKAISILVISVRPGSMTNH